MPFRSSGSDARLPPPHSQTKPRDSGLRREELATIFDLRFDLDDWVNAEGEVLDRPTYVRIAKCRFMLRG